MRQKEIVIQLPPTMVNENQPYTMLINNEIQINLVSHVQANENKALIVKHDDCIVFPLPTPKGMWMVKTQNDKKLVLIDV